MDLNRDMYSNISEIYSRRGQEHEYTVLKRREELAKKLPEYDTIQNEIISLYAKKTKLMITGKHNEASNVDIKISQLENKQRSILKEAGYSSDYLSPPYVCPMCKDTGYVEEGGARVRCVCYKKMIIDYVYKENGALNRGERFCDLDMDYQIGEHKKNFELAVNKSRHFVNSFTSGEGCRNLLIYGNAGIGKTTLCNCIVNEIGDLSAWGYTCIYQSAPQMFRKIMSSKYNGDNSGYQLLLNCDLLVIDDLGTEIVSEAVVSELYQLINSRINYRKPVIISTNFSSEKLRETYGQRIYSRIAAEEFVKIKMTGQDVRILKQKRNM